MRYTGVSFVYQFSGIFASGLIPLIASALLVWAGGEPWLVAGYMVLVAAISLLSVDLLPEIHRRDILPTATPVTATRPD